MYLHLLRRLMHVRSLYRQISTTNARLGKSSLDLNFVTSSTGRRGIASASGKNLPANPLPATFIRGGTSKGIFINRNHLPENPEEWNKVFLGLMGSPDPYGRQLNGMGGGISSLSKICVVGTPTTEQKEQGIDVAYTFVQVGIKDTVIDISGNCGNLSSMIGAFALDDGICHVRPSEQNTETPTRVTVRSFNTNTNKAVDTTFPVSLSSSDVSPTAVLDLPEVEMAGVPGFASRIDMEFLHPAGARTGKLLPAGSPTSEVSLDKNSVLHVSCVDATNPTVFLAAQQFRAQAGLREEEPIDFAHSDTLKLLEKIRRSGAVLMGLDPLTQAQPKVAVLSLPTQEDIDKGVEIVIHALSMGVLHKAVPGTVGLCLGAAAQVPGTVAWEIMQESRAKRQGSGPEEGFVRMRHPSGVTDVGAVFNSDGTLKSVKVIRTGRRLMKGSVWW